MNWKLGGGRICAFTQCKKCQNFVILLIPKQYHLKCNNNINIVLYLGFADIILGEIFIQDTGYRTCGVSLDLWSIAFKSALQFNMDVNH